MKRHVGEVLKRYKTGSDLQKSSKKRIKTVNIKFKPTDEDLKKSYDIVIEKNIMLTLLLTVKYKNQKKILADF